jgi:hypothetical protein
MTTARQDREFNEMLMEHLRQDSALEKCIAWIAENMNPQLVFSQCDLETWAQDNGYIKDTES